MHLLRNFLILADWVVALAWVTRVLHWLRGVARVPDLSLVPAAMTTASTRTLSVVVPARNEQRGIEACLRSLLESSGVSLQVIAVDDRSTDDTGKVMDRLAEGNASLSVIHIENLPDGWMGKTHAMACAAAEATGEWLLFTDGDIVYQADALARVMAFASREAADHVVLYPTMILRGAGEQMMMSFLHALSIWGVRPWKVGEESARNDFIGIGAFNLIRRPVYDAMGGWGALRLEVLEDLRMGFSIKRAGYHQRAVFGRDLTRVRWAEGAFGIVTNMTKNLFALFRFRLLIASMALVSLFLLCLLPLLGLGLGWAGLGPFLLTSGSLVALYLHNRRLGLPGAAHVLSFPVGSVLFLFAVARSIVATLLQGGVNWRGTFYPLKELRSHAGPLR